MKKYCKVLVTLSLITTIILSYTIFTIRTTANSQNTTKIAHTLPNWNSDSKTVHSIVSFVQSVTDQNSENYIPEEKRIVVFDFDGTLYGEHFPMYFDQSMLIYRLLYDKNYTATAEQKEFAKGLELTYLDNQPDPESSKTVEQVSAESFEGFSIKDYRTYIRKFMSFPVIGFDGMTYGDGFYLPMVSLVQYLSENNFTIFVSTGSECDLVREIMRGTLDKWIPPYSVIGSTFSLAATGQGNIVGDEYTYSPDDKIFIEGKDVTFRNLKTNKIVSLINQIGAIPIMTFGNSSGDFSIAQYVTLHGGKSYMLVLDDIDREYVNLEDAESFKKSCEELGFETISAKTEFETIYNKNIVKTNNNYRFSEIADYLKTK